MRAVYVHIGNLDNLLSIIDLVFICSLADLGYGKSYLGSGNAISITELVIETQWKHICSSFCIVVLVYTLWHRQQFYAYDTVKLIRVMLS